MVQINQSNIMNNNEFMRSNKRYSIDDVSNMHESRDGECSIVSVIQSCITNK